MRWRRGDSEGASLPCVCAWAGDYSERRGVGERHYEAWVCWDGTWVDESGVAGLSSMYELVVTWAEHPPTSSDTITARGRGGAFLALRLHTCSPTSTQSSSVCWKNLVAARLRNRLRFFMLLGGLHRHQGGDGE